MIDGGEGARPLRRQAVELLLVSFVVLFQELALIRWLPGQVRVLAYFPNVILLSAFLGLGVGALRARGRCLAWLWPVSLVVVAGLGVALSRVAFTHDAPHEGFWLLYYDLGKDAPTFRGLRTPILAFFLLSTLSFVPLGQALAQRIQAFRDAGRPLIGYSWDLAGSLLGTIGFALVSFTGAFPWAWFTAFLLPGAVLFARRPRALAAYAAAATALVAFVAGTERSDAYSPYYALRVEPKDGQVIVLTNGSVHQVALDMRRGRPMPDEAKEVIREGYHLPYQLLGRPIRKALVLGAGTGNDVATLLDEGAAEVHAVEIDPEILRMGRSMHPARPYDSPRVKVFNTDARSHLNDTPERYDLIVFGTLDSMTRLSALSSVRLDNFVYTRDALRAAASRLTDDGGLVLYFMVGNEFIGDHLHAMLSDVFGEPPLVRRENRGLFNTVFVAGPAFADARAAAGAMPSEAAMRSSPSDDWPYLYLRSRGVSAFYLSVIALILGSAVALVAVASPELRRSARAGSVDVEMILFGMGFLLLETKLVTSMTLVWGATWVTSAVVFGAILLTILVATLLTHRRSLPLGVAAALLVASLVVTWAIPTGALVGRAIPLRLLLSVLFVGAPVGFASACFAARFRLREHADAAFGWNVLGAVAGGLLEFGSMATGLRAMHLVALAIYLGVMLTWLRERQAPPATAAAA